MTWTTNEPGLRRQLAQMARHFERARCYAIEERNRGRIEAARFHASQARGDWRTLQLMLGGGRA